MAYKLKRYQQKKVASKMKRNELELTVKGLAKSLNDFMEKGRKSDMTVSFTNSLAKSGYQIERKNKKGKKIKGVSVRVSGLTKDELIKKIADDIKGIEFNIYYNSKAFNCIGIEGERYTDFEEVPF